MEKLPDKISRTQIASFLLISLLLTLAACSGGGKSGGGNQPLTNQAEIDALYLESGDPLPEEVWNKALEKRKSIEENKSTSSNVHPLFYDETAIFWMDNEPFLPLIGPFAVDEDREGDILAEIQNEWKKTIDEWVSYHNEQNRLPRLSSSENLADNSAVEGSSLPSLKGDSSSHLSPTDGADTLPQLGGTTSSNGTAGNSSDLTGDSGSNLPNFGNAGRAGGDALLGGDGSQQFIESGDELPNIKPRKLTEDETRNFLETWEESTLLPRQEELYPVVQEESGNDFDPYKDLDELVAAGEVNVEPGAAPLLHWNTEKSLYQVSKFAQIVVPGMAVAGTVGAFTAISKLMGKKGLSSEFRNKLSGYIGLSSWNVAAQSPMLLLRSLNPAVFFYAIMSKMTQENTWIGKYTRRFFEKNFKSELPTANIKLKNGQSLATYYSFGSIHVDESADNSVKGLILNKRQISRNEIEITLDPSKVEVPEGGSNVIRVKIDHYAKQPYSVGRIHEVNEADVNKFIKSVEYVDETHVKVEIDRKSFSLGRNHATTAEVWINDGAQKALKESGAKTPEELMALFKANDSFKYAIGDQTKYWVLKTNLDNSFIVENAGEFVNKPHKWNKTVIQETYIHGNGRKTIRSSINKWLETSGATSFIMEGTHDWLGFPKLSVALDKIARVDLGGTIAWTGFEIGRGIFRSGVLNFNPLWKQLFAAGSLFRFLGFINGGMIGSAIGWRLPDLAIYSAVKLDNKLHELFPGIPFQAPRVGFVTAPESSCIGMLQRTMASKYKVRGREFSNVNQVKDHMKAVMGEFNSPRLKNAMNKIGLGGFVNKYNLVRLVPAALVGGTLAYSLPRKHVQLRDWVLDKKEDAAKTIEEWALEAEKDPDNATPLQQAAVFLRDVLKIDTQPVMGEVPYDTAVFPPEEVPEIRRVDFDETEGRAVAIDYDELEELTTMPNDADYFEGYDAIEACSGVRSPNEICTQEMLMMNSANKWSNCAGVFVEEIDGARVYSVRVDREIRGTFNYCSEAKSLLTELRTSGIPANRNRDLTHVLFSSFLSSAKNFLPAYSIAMEMDWAQMKKAFDEDNGLSSSMTELDPVKLVQNLPERQQYIQEIYQNLSVAEKRAMMFVIINLTAPVTQMTQEYLEMAEKSTTVDQLRATIFMFQERAGMDTIETRDLFNSYVAQAEQHEYIDIVSFVKEEVKSYIATSELAVMMQMIHNFDKEPPADVIETFFAQEDK